MPPPPARRPGPAGSECPVSQASPPDLPRTPGAPSHPRAIGQQQRPRRGLRVQPDVHEEPVALPDRQAAAGDREWCWRIPAPIADTSANWPEYGEGQMQSIPRPRCSAREWRRGELVIEPRHVRGAFQPWLGD